MQDSLFPTSWRFVPIVAGKKSPAGLEWEKRLYEWGNLPALDSWITVPGKEGKPYKTKIGAYGVVTGIPSGGLLMLDLDGRSARQWCKQYGVDLPPTWSVSRGNPDRCQLAYWVPESEWQGCNGHKFVSNKEEKEGVEFRWSGGKVMQSLVFGVHPEGSWYEWDMPESGIATATNKMIAILKGEDPTASASASAPIQGQLQWKDFANQFSLPHPDRIPLELGLAKDNRDRLNGVSSYRNDNAATLARDLIGVAAYFDAIGQRYDGDPYQLFIDFCQKCPQDDWKPREWDTVWKSAQKSNPQPSCPPDAIEASIKGWLWKQQKENNVVADQSAVEGDRVSESSGESKPVKAIPSYKEALDYVAYLKQEFEDAGELEWEIRRYAHESGLSKYGLNVSTLLRLSMARQDAEQAIEIEDVHDLLNSTDTRKWLIGGLLPLGSIVILSGSGGSGKTTLLYEFAKCLAMGVNWSGLPTMQCKTLIIQTDEPKVDIKDKLESMGFRDVPKETIGMIRRWRFTQLDKLEMAVRKHDYKLVIIDSYTAAHAGMNVELSKSNAGDSIYQLRDLADELGFTVVIVHHHNKANEMRDSSTIRDNASEIWSLKKDDREVAGANDWILGIPKSRAGMAGVYAILKNPVNFSWTFGGSLEGGHYGISSILSLFENNSDRKMSVQDVQQMAGSTYDSVLLTLEYLRRVGLVNSESVTTSVNGVPQSRYRLYWAIGSNLQPIESEEPEETFLY